MHLSTLLAASLLPTALALPCTPGGIVRWGSSIIQSFTWAEGPGPLDQMIVSSSVDEESIYDVLNSRDEFSQLVKFIDKEEDVVDILKDKKRGVTFFAPNNEAIDKVKEWFGHHGHHGGEDGKGFDAKGRFIKDTLLYHIVPEVIEFNRFGQNSTLATESRARDGSFGDHRRRVKVETNTLPPWKVTLNNYITITQSDIRATNGVIHKVDFPVFLPLDIFDALFLLPNEFSISTTAALKVDLQNEYEFNSPDYQKGRKDRKEHNDRHGSGEAATTFFVPNNNAWNQLPKDLLAYLFSPIGERALRKLLQFHTIPDGLVFSEWGREVDEDDHRKATGDNDDLSFEWDHHFPSLTNQKLPVHAKKTRSVLPGSNSYNIELQAHGLYAKSWDNVAQNGAIHVLDDVLSPRQKEGIDKNQNNKDWEEWKDWFFDWVDNTHSN